ncbi:MAG: hypothetical protein ACRD8Z_03235, partial [Nitrososphaeraceae archaeon]
MQVLNEDAKVNVFLESIGRNSNNSRKLYRTGLYHFAQFLQPKQTPDTIILLLQNQCINQYELLDQFVSYLLKQHIAISTLKIY